MASKPGYIPTLDGWRAIAIVAVFFAHTQPLALPGDYGRSLGIFLANNGGRGVDVFFAISGLLICTRLLEEEDRHGRISIRNFYIRRAFRILPPAVFFLLVLMLLHMYGPIPLNLLDWFSCLFFFRNYTMNLSGPPLNWWFTSHFWSLSVEEHFYLILPAVLVLLPRWRLRALVGLAFLSTVWKLWLKYLLHIAPDPLAWALNFHTEGCIDALMIPAAIAVYQRSARGKAIMSAWLTSRMRLLLLIPLGALLFYRWPLWPMGRFSMALIILTTVYNPDSIPSRFLEYAPVRWIGRLSYSLYLWQMLFLCSRFSVTPPLGRIQMFPLNALCLLACACFSYYCVERPMIRIGHSLTRSSN
jgi:peptidoglycan/LPS O-acetylase OafA/YrhL